MSIAIGNQGSVSALLYLAARDGRAETTIILGHGAGANQMSRFIRVFAGGLAARGFDTLTFNFLYSERGRHVPDPKAKLETCFNAIIDAARKHRRLKSNRLVIGGKSMGGRIASQVAAAGAGDIAALVFLGYPLHPPGNPEKLRAEHLPDIHSPMLFVQGARDTFGTPEELRAVFKQLRVPATLYSIEGGDHSFTVTKSSRVSQPEVYEAVMNEIARWLSEASAIQSKRQE